MDHLQPDSYEDHPDTMLCPLYTTPLSQLTRNGSLPTQPIIRMTGQSYTTPNQISLPLIAAPTPPMRPLRILVLDGGGFQGLGSLIVLDALMRKVVPEDDEDEQIFLQDHFDLVMGTSTGGLQALMLGRLGLSVGDTESKYMEMGPKIFEDGPGVLRWATLGDARFDAGRFEECIRVNLKGGEALKTKYNHLRSVVISTMADMPLRPVYLRSYPLRGGPDPPTGRRVWTIGEAARATSAAPVYFDPINVFGSNF